MKNNFILVLNAGRSGSSFLSYLLKENFSEVCYVAHEDIPVQISKPRINNRAYDANRLEALLKDEAIMQIVQKWQHELKSRHVVETGWTSYHLAPLLYKVFGEQMKILIMHRDPISFAFSRASMGNYHPDTFYDDAHEVSPFDPYTIFPEKKDQWPQMNHFEKCMFWWSVVYKEAFEFKERNQQIPSLVVKSKDIFNFKRTDEILQFIGLEPKDFVVKNVERNELATFVKETFPIHDEWKAYQKHPDILDFGQGLGYDFDYERVERLAKKYRLPKGFIPFLRHMTRYWVAKRKFKSLILNSK